MSFFVIYLLMIISNLKIWLIWCAAGCGVIGATGVFFHVVEDYDVPRCYKILLTVAIIASLMIALIPDRKEMAMIAAGGITYNVVTSDAAKEIGGKGLELLKKKIDDMLVEDKTDSKK